MRAFILVSCLLAAVAARPDIGLDLGYNYKGAQQNQLGLPQNVHNLQPHIHQQLPQEHSFSSFDAPKMTYLAPLASLPPSAPSEIISTPSAPEEIAQPLAAEHPEDSYNAAYQESGIQHETGYSNGPQQTQVHKHIYVHVPPKDFEDEDVIETRVRHQTGHKQKHYKIVFIKAPAAPMVRPPVVPPPPENEEKTLIYVLHKKPEPQQEIIIPTPAPTTPAKPEVYFIKYKTKKEQPPVYGPPPAGQSPNPYMEPRHAEQPSIEYGAPTAEALSGLENADLSAPITTLQPAMEDQRRLEDIHDVATMTAFAAASPDEELVQPTAPASLPSKKYLAPAKSTLAPIVVEEPHAPSTRYGPPNRFFIKKKK